MAIKISSQIEPQSQLGYTHEDVYGKGGYVVVTSSLTSTPTPTEVNQALNGLVAGPRRKAGMLVYDTTTAKAYRCSGAELNEWSPSLESVDLTEYVQRSDLPLDGGVLDIASESTLLEFGRTAIRVSPDATANLTVETFNDSGDSRLLFTEVTPASGSTPASIKIRFNTAIGILPPNDGN